MAAITRRAEIHWEGDSRRGGGKLLLSSSGAGGELPVSIPTRSSDDAKGETSPEELLAASHAGCYTTALSLLLSIGRTPPDHLDTSAVVTLERSDEGLRISRSELTVRGRVPGVEPDKFQEAVRAAEQYCPISQAISGNVEIAVDAQLEDG